MTTPLQAYVNRKGFAERRDWADLAIDYYEDQYDRDSGRRAMRMALRTLGRRLVVDFIRWLRSASL